MPLGFVVGNWLALIIFSLFSKLFCSERDIFYGAIGKDFTERAKGKEYVARIYGMPKSVICGRLPSIVVAYRAYCLVLADHAEVCTFAE